MYIYIYIYIYIKQYFYVAPFIKDVIMVDMNLKILALVYVGGGQLFQTGPQN